MQILTQLVFLVAFGSIISVPPSYRDIVNPLGTHPLFKKIMANRFGKTVKEMEDMFKTTTRDYIELLVLEKNQKDTELDPSPYFPFNPDRGYINIYGEDNAMWYWHFKARKNPETAPLVIWFEGGPGGASTSDVFLFNGPFQIHNWPTGGKKATLKEVTWVDEVNMVYPDFPLGVGFSTVTGDKLSRIGAQVQEQILIFFEKFLEKYPEYKKRPVYVAGV